MKDVGVEGISCGRNVMDSIGPDWHHRDRDGHAKQQRWLKIHLVSPKSEQMAFLLAETLITLKESVCSIVDTCRDSAGIRDGLIGSREDGWKTGD
jgi:hypothetical protein